MASPAPASAATPSAMANASTRLGPSAGTSFDAGAGQRERAECLGDEAQAGDKCTEAAALLEVQRQHEGLASDDRAHPKEREVGSEHATVLEQGEVHQRRCRPPLLHDEAAEEHRRNQDQDRRLGDSQRVTCPCHSQHEHSHARRDRHGARDIRLVPARRLVGGKETPRTEEQCHPDRGR